MKVQLQHFMSAPLMPNVPNIALLNLFFTQMPKGGDLHHHYSGSIYAETYLEWVKNKHWYIDSCTFKIVPIKNSDGCKALSVDELIANDTLYRKLLTLWSDKDFSNHSHEQLPPDSNFFNTFGYFSPISDQYMDVSLNIIKERAINEDVSYIESMPHVLDLAVQSFLTPMKSKCLTTNCAMLLHKKRSTLC